MTLREKRVLFTHFLAHLILIAEDMGYEVALNEVVRDKRVAELNAASGAGISTSLHLDGLAADINLYRDGVWLSKTEDHEPLGVLWESFHELAKWGGRFGDGNHYSFTHNGRR